MLGWKSKISGLIKKTNLEKPRFIICQLLVLTHSQLLSNVLKLLEGFL
jgi:hypothetical protein